MYQRKSKNVLVDKKIRKAEKIYVVFISNFFHASKLAAGKKIAHFSSFSKGPAPFSKLDWSCAGPCYVIIAFSEFRVHSSDRNATN